MFPKEQMSGNIPVTQSQIVNLFFPIKNNILKGRDITGPRFISEKGEYDHFND